MTKLKNTKKGMAKKALSISLVAAMLATSNVPVWAAEFTDGTDAVVEAPVVEEAVDTFSAEAEAPVEEVQEAPVVAAETTGTGYKATLGDFTYGSGAVTNKEVVWGDTIKVPLTVTPDSGTDTGKVYAVWKLDGNAIATPSAYKDVVANSGNCQTEVKAEYAGKKLSLYVFATTGTATDPVVWSYTSDEISVKAKDINTVDELTAKGAVTLGKFAPTYDGKSHVPTMEDVTLGSGVKNFTKNDFTLGAAVGDTVNVTKDGCYVLLSANKAGYTGSLKLTYQIEPVSITNTNVNDYFAASFVTTSTPYTGKAIELDRSYVKLVDKKSNTEVTTTYVQEEGTIISIQESDAKAGNEFKDILTFPLKAAADEKNSNYKIAAGVAIKPDGKFAVTQRDLSTVEVTIPEQKNVNGTLVIKATSLKFKEKDTNKELNLGKDVADISLASSVGSHTVDIKPATNNKNVTGSTTAVVRVSDTSLANAEFENNTYATQAEEYTGERITKDITKLGVLKINGTVISSDNYEVQFGTNIDAGDDKGVIRIIGKQSYQGSEKEIYFDINPAKVNKDTVTFNEFVEKKDTTNPEDYKTAIGLVVKAKNANGKEFTLTEGTDFVATYEFSDKTGEVGAKVNVTLKNKDGLLKNTNFKLDGAVTINPTITQTTLKDENIKLKQTSYVYTGQAIEPKFDVVVDGAVIAPSEYKIKSLVGNINVGTATVEITGTGNDYSDKVSAKASFTITPAKAEDLKATINGQQYTGYSIHPKLETVELNGVSINVKDNFTVTYGENIKIGEGTVTLTPKNGNFTGSKTITFKIVGQLISGGKLNYYDANGLVVAPKHHYDGTAYKCAKTVFDFSTTTGLDGEKLVEGTDYEIKYVDNVYGKKDSNKKQQGTVLVVGKGLYAGNYTGATVEDGIYTDAVGNKIENVIYAEQFEITQEDIAISNVSVKNGTYAGGLVVKPEVTINVKGKALVEGVDYDLKLDIAGNTDMANATASKSLKVTIEPKNGYKAAKASDLENLAWGIDKFDFANAEVIVNGDKVTVKCGSVDVPTSNYTVTKDAEKDTVTITATKDNKNYTGTKTVNTIVTEPEEKPEAPMITDVTVKGNNATVILSGDSEGATGYDYVISKDRDCINNKKYAKVNKNILTTKTTFTYTGQGTYYAYCHAWKKVDGKKVFSDWSNAYPFVVTSITPEQPAITSVKVSKNTVKVTYTKSANATGYDIVLGKSMKKVNGEMRPVNYGKLVKKVYKGNTVTATFTKVPKGTYYVGLHAYNRTSEDGKKVFSPWSNAKKVVVK